MTNSASDRLKKAQNYLAAGDAERAEKICRKLLKVKELYLPTRVLLSKALVGQNKLLDAATIMAQAADHAPGNPALQTAAGEMLARTEESPRAVPYLQKALAADPTKADLWQKLIESMFNAYEDNKLSSNDPGELSTLVSLANKAIQNFPNHSGLLATAGQIFQSADKTDAAILCFEKCLGQGPILTKAHHGWLKIKHEKEDYPAILNYADKYADVIATDAVCLRTAAAAHENLGQFYHALDYLNRVLDLAPDNDEYLASRGRVFYYLSRFDEALQDLNRSLERSPEQPSARQNRCLTLKCKGDIAAAAKDEFERFKLIDKHGKFELQSPLWMGQKLSQKRLFIWSDMGVGDVFKYAPLIRELPEDCHPIFMSQNKTVAFLEQALPGIEIRALPKHIIPPIPEGQTAVSPLFVLEGEEDFDLQIPLACLYTQLRPTIESFAHKTRPHSLPEKFIEPFRALPCLSNPDTVKVGLAWSSKNRNAMNERNYLSMEDLLPLMRMPGFEFYNFQYSTGEEEILAFAQKHDVPLYHAPGLDLMDDLLGTAAFNCCMDLFVSPASTCSDIAGSVGIKSLRLDLAHLPENLGLDHIPWYIDQETIQVPWGKSIQDFIPDMMAWLEENKSHHKK